MNISKSIILLIFLVGFANAYTSSGNAFYCNSCEDCTAALNDNRYQIVYLENDISLSENARFCIPAPENFTNKVFDCQGHKIIGHGIDLDPFENSIGVAVWDEWEIVRQEKLTSKNNNTIKRCVVTEFDIGFSLDETVNDIILTDNIAYGNEDAFSIFSSNTIITNNTAYENFGFGFYVFSGNENTLIDNTAHGNSESGFYVDYNKNSILTNNIAYNNLQHGFYLNIDYNNINGNIAYNNQQHGFYIEGENNMLKENIAYDNSESGFDLNSAHTNSFINNEAYNNAESGFYFTTTDTNILTNNTVYNNKNGFFFKHIESSTLTSNTALNNSEYGLYMGSYSIITTLVKNKICNNKIDIYIIELDAPWLNWMDNSATENICDLTENWNDEGTTGCTYTCSGAGGPTTSIIDSIIDAVVSFVEGLINAILSFFTPETEETVLTSYDITSSDVEEKMDGQSPAPFDAESLDSSMEHQEPAGGLNYQNILSLNPREKKSLFLRMKVLVFQHILILILV